MNTAAYNNDRNGGSTYSVSQEVGPLNFAKPGTENVEALYNGDSAVNIYVVKSREHNEGAKTPSRLADLSWRYLTDLDTFTNRSGHTQYFTPDAHEGAWIRFRYRNLGIDGTGELDGNTYELGYTTVLRNQEPHKHRLSTSVAYTKNEGHFEGTSGNLGFVIPPSAFMIPMCTPRQSSPGKPTGKRHLQLLGQLSQIPLWQGRLQCH